MLEQILLSKIITLEVIVESLLEELFKKGIIDKESYDEAVTLNVTKLENKLKKIQSEEIEDTDYSNILKGPIGKA